MQAPMLPGMAGRFTVPQQARFGGVKARLADLLNVILRRGADARALSASTSVTRKVTTRAGAVHCMPATRFNSRQLSRYRERILAPVWLLDFDAATSDVSFNEQL